MYFNNILETKNNEALRAILHKNILPIYLFFIFLFKLATDFKYY